MIMNSGSILLCALLLALGSALSRAQDGTGNVDIGVILDLDSYVGKMSRTCLEMAVDDFYGAHRNYATRLVLHFRDSKSNAVEAASAGEHNDTLIPPLFRFRFATLLIFFFFLAEDMVSAFVYSVTKITIRLELKFIRSFFSCRSFLSSMKQKWQVQSSLENGKF